MLEQDYKELMNEIRPEEAMVEAMVDRQKAGRKVAFFPKMMKIAAAVLCSLVVLAGGVVAADAATDGAVRKLFGFKDSVSNGTMEAKFVERKHAYKNHYSYTLYDENGEMIVHAGRKEDTPMFLFGFELSDEDASYLSVPLTRRELEPEDVYEWHVYYSIHSQVAFLSGDYYGYEYEKGTAEYEEMVQSIEDNLKEIDTSTELGKACARGIQRALEDFKDDRNWKVLPFRIWDKVNLTDKGNWTLRGISYVKVDTEEWMRETEETGRTEFIVEAIGGVKKTYKVKVKSYSPFEYTYEPVE